MRCYLDQSELSPAAASLPGTATLGAWLEAARREASELGRLVVEVRLNDAVIGHAQLDAALDTPLSPADRLNLVTADPAELGVDALAEARTQLTEVGALQQAAAEQLQADHAGEALRQVGEAVQHWIHIAHAVTQVAQLTSLDLDGLVVAAPQGTEPASAIISGLGGSLTELRDLIQSGDTTGLADALGYEWPTLIARWDALLAGMGDRLAA